MGEERIIWGIAIGLASVLAIIFAATNGGSYGQGFEDGVEACGKIQEIERSAQ